MHAILTITWLTFHEARRRRMVMAALLLGGVFVVLFAIGVWLINREIVQSGTPEALRIPVYSFLLIAGLYVTHFLVVMLAIFASVDAIAGEITSHTIQTIVTKPVRRWHVLLGKWLGYVLMIELYLALLMGGLCLTMYGLVGYIPSNLLQGLSLLGLEALTLLSLSLWGGTHLTTLTNGVILFMLYGVAFIGAWVEQIGALFQSQNAVRIGIITSLIMPVEALWRRAAYLLQPPLLQSIPSPFSLVSAPSAAMSVYAVLYAVVALLLALRAFEKRDL